jgi:hypothetical protein
MLFTRTLSAACGAADGPLRKRNTVQIHVTKHSLLGFGLVLPHRPSLMGMSAISWQMWQMLPFRHHIHFAKRLFPCAYGCAAEAMDEVDGVDSFSAHGSWF